jgi:hypothetical protein
MSPLNLRYRLLMTDTMTASAENACGVGSNACDSQSRNRPWRLRHGNLPGDPSTAPLWSAGADTRESAVPGPCRERSQALSNAWRNQHWPQDTRRARAKPARAVEARELFGRTTARVPRIEGGVPCVQPPGSRTARHLFGGDAPSPQTATGCTAQPPPQTASSVVSGSSELTVYGVHPHLELKTGSKCAPTRNPTLIHCASAFGSFWAACFRSVTHYQRSNNCQ